MKDVYVVDALRTPIGKYGGALSRIRPDDLAAFLISALMERNQHIDANSIEDVILGDANQAGEDNRNVARMALLLAGLPVHIAGSTVNRLCASGLDAIMNASRAIRTGDGEIYLAGGVESMSRAPFVMGKSENAFSRKAEIYDTTIGWRFLNEKLSDRYYPFSMGETAENVAKKYKISREDQDMFAFESQKKYQQAYDAGKFADEIIPVTTTDEKGEAMMVHKDEHPRATNLEKLSTLKPAFSKDGTVTAGNSSGINDGAAILLLASEQVIKEQKLQPLARVAAMAVAGVDPAYMGMGPVPATEKVLRRAGLKSLSLDLIELNEAFASQSIACIRELKLDPEKVNVNGGAIALGHPLGCSGARISATLLHEMKRRKCRYGLATMCVGVGQGAAILYEAI
jgi:3-oxoadipyl-CoA thiolase